MAGLPALDWRKAAVLTTFHNVRAPESPEPPHVRPAPESHRPRRPRHHHPRRPRAQSQERRRHHPARPAGGVHRAVRLRQVVARLRHYLRRGPAPLCRVLVGLRPPVPGDDAEAGRRPDRRPVAGHLHRAEDDVEEPALDRRHRHRDLRLHAPAVGARRHSLFAGDGPAHRKPDRQPDGRPRAGTPRRHAHLRAGAARARPQGRVQEGIGRAAEEGLPAGQDRRRIPRDPGRQAARQEVHPRHRRRRRSPCGQRRYRHAARRLPRAMPQARRRPRRHRARRHQSHGRRRQPRPQRHPRASHLLGEVRLPGVRLHDFRDRAAAVLVQQPVRRLPGMRRPRAGAAHRRRAGHPRQGRHACARAPSRRGRSRHRPITSRRCRRSASTTASRSTPSGRTCRRRRKTRSSTAPATTRSSSSTTTACAAIRPRSRSRASSPTWSAASRKPNPSGRARTWRNTSPTCPATPAMARGSSRKRCASRSPAPPSPTSRSCRCARPATGSATCRSSFPPSRTRSPAAS